MPAPTGFQVAFLVLAFQFFAMLVARRLSAALSWPAEWYELLGQIVTIGGAAVLLAAVGPLRRLCAAELARALPAGALREIAIVSAAKAAIPFAVVGAIVLWSFGTGEPARILALVPSVDPARAWALTLSPEGLFRMVALTWAIGPVVEELVFRGLLYRAWERQWGWLASLVLTSACFAVFHPGGMTSSFLGSVVYVCVLRRTGTLRGCILVHIAFNVLVSWPVLGRLLHAVPEGEVARLSAWTLPLASLVFVSVALPAYLRMARVDARAPVAR